MPRQTPERRGVVMRHCQNGHATRSWGSPIKFLFCCPCSKAIVRTQTITPWGHWVIQQGSAVNCTVRRAISMDFSSILTAWWLSIKAAMLTALKSINFGLAPCLPHSQCVQEYCMDSQSVLLLIPIYAENLSYFPMSVLQTERWFKRN